MSFLVRLPRELYDRNAFSAFAPGSFSIGNARAAMWLAQLSYEDENTKQDSVLKQWGVRRIASFNQPLLSVLPMSSTDGFVARNENTVFIAFKGTDPLLTVNWVTNFKFLPNKLGIHEGFGEALNAVWSDIIAALEQSKPISRLLTTGHSLGAALAALCASRLTRETGVTAEAIYGFGMPRVGNPAFAAAYNALLGDRTYRFVYGSDIVPTVPPAESGFSHVGRYLPCEANQRFAANALSAKPSDAPAFVEGLLSGMEAGLHQLFFGRGTIPADSDLIIRASQLLPPGLADHLPDRYWRALKTE
jgi:triacylglycerol lipase